MIFNFELNENEANLIFQALGELPAKVSLSLLNKLHTEVAKQMNEQKGMMEPAILSIDPELHTKVSDIKKDK